MAGSWLLLLPLLQAAAQEDYLLYKDDALGRPLYVAEEKAGDEALLMALGLVAGVSKLFTVKLDC